MRWWIAAIVLRLSTAVEAETLAVRFQTWPSGARVFVNGDFAGLSGDIIDLRRPQGPVSIEFRRWDLSYEFKLQDGDFPALRDEVNNSQNIKHYYPRQRPIELVGPGWQMGCLWLLDHSLALALLGGASLAALRHFDRRRRKQKKLELLTAASYPGQGSMVLQQMGGYRLVDLLGRGGMGSVYRAYREDDLDGQSSYAIKVIEAGAGHDPEFRERFLREIKVCAQLDHPHIIRIYDWGEVEGRLYLVMEEVEGKVLRDWVRPGGCPPAWVEGLLEQLLPAIQYAHERGVVHRDLKPDNLIIDGRGRVKIMDFGLARHTDSQSHLTQTGTALGTPAYMAPEQFSSAGADPRQDQYSLGIMVFELLAGRRPFLGEAPMQLMYQHLHQAPPGLCELRPDLPPRWEQIVRRMLAKDRQDRFPDLKSVAEALKDE